MFKSNILAALAVCFFAFAGLNQAEAQISESYWYIHIEGDEGNNEVDIYDFGNGGLWISLRQKNGYWVFKTFEKAKPIICNLRQGNNRYVNNTSTRDRIEVDWAPGRNEIWCGDGGSSVRCMSTGNDLIVGGSGDDYIQAGDGSDLVVGGDGDDTLFESHWGSFLREGGNTPGDGSEDWLAGGDGDDTIYSGSEDKTWEN